MKTTYEHNFLHNLLLSSFAKLMQTVMFNRYHEVRPNIYFTNIASQITMPWNRPWCSFQLEIFRKYAQISFRKSQKISRSYLKPFGRYSRKTRGVDKNNPPPLPLIGLIRWILVSHVCRNAPHLSQSAIQGTTRHFDPNYG